MAKPTPPWPEDYEQDDRGRSRQIKRVIRLIVFLSSRGHSITEIAEELHVSTKTVRRDIRALEDIQIPVYCDQTTERDGSAGSPLLVWRVDPRWMRRFV